MYTILAETKCEYGVVNELGLDLEFMLEKPDVLWCDDGVLRLRDKEGKIYDYKFWSKEKYAAQKKP